MVTSQVAGERLELRLDLVGDPQQLYELIALDRDLLPIESSMAVRSGLAALPLDQVGLICCEF